MNFKSLLLLSNTSLLIKIGTITINTFLSTRNKRAYSCSIKIHALGFDALLESILCLLLVVEAFSLQEVVKMLKEGQVNTQWMRQNFVAQFVQLLKHWLCECAVGRCCEELGPFC